MREQTAIYNRSMQPDPELESLRRRAASKREKARRQKERDDGVRSFVKSVPADQLERMLAESGDETLMALGRAYEDPPYRFLGFVALSRRFGVSPARLEKAWRRYNRAIRGANQLADVQQKSR